MKKPIVKIINKGLKRKYNPRVMLAKVKKGIWHINVEFWEKGLEHSCTGSGEDDGHSLELFFTEYGSDGKKYIMIKIIFVEGEKDVWDIGKMSKSCYYGTLYDDVQYLKLLKNPIFYNEK